jgi:hypothetical protein
MPETIDSLTRSVLAEIAPRQLAYVEPVADGVFAGGRHSRRAMLAALGEGRESSPTGFGAETMGLVVGFLLTVLNGVACELFAAELSAAAHPLRGRWRARRERRRLTAKTSPDGLATPLPTLSAVAAAQVGQRVLVLAKEAGIGEEEAQRISTLLAAALMEKS